MLAHKFDQTADSAHATAQDTSTVLSRTQVQVSPRLLRLFACACCRRVFDRLAPDCRQAVEVAERFADGSAAPADLDDAWRLAGRLEVLRRLATAGAFLAGRSNGL